MFKNDNQMLSVIISVNGNPVMGRSATNMGSLPDGKNKYLADDGKFIMHNPKDGIVKLAMKLLNNIKEVKK